MLAALAALALLGVVCVVATLWYFSRGLPSIEALRDYRPPQTTRVVDRNGETIGEIFNERRTVVPMSKIPRVLVLSVLAAEDADFYQHKGLDYQGIARAVVRDLIAGRPAQGASTITQQVVKLILLTPERTITRKIKELILARRLEQQMSKDEILNLYLNYVNFGHGRYGVEQAAQYYFGKPAIELSLAEASLIAGIPQSPARLSPRTHEKAAERRQTYVLGQLKNKRAAYWPDLSMDAISAAADEEIVLREFERTTNPAPEVMQMARDALKKAAGDEAITEGGYTVHTSLDLHAQRSARAALRAGLTALDGRQKLLGPTNDKRSKRSPPDMTTLRFGRTYPAIVARADDEQEQLRLKIGEHEVVLPMKYVARYNPDSLSPSAFATPGHEIPVSMVQLPTEQSGGVVRLERGPQGAVVAIDVRTRDVLALVGHYEESSGFDRATRAIRQPGSAFKPIVYALGIKSRRFTAASMMFDAPAVYDEWKPQNYEKWSFAGAVRLRDALAHSINMVAVSMVEELGAKAVISFSKDLGITTKLEADLALALGASGVKPIELVNAYATFASGGRWGPTAIIKRIEGPTGVIPLPDRTPPRQVLRPDEAYVITSLLRSVVDYGTGASAQRLQRPVVGKTGTSNNARDAWFVGYTPDVALGVWVGYDDHRSLGRRESGTRAALPIWIDAMKGAVDPSSKPDFVAPTQVVTETIDPASGLLAYEGQTDAVQEVFLAGTTPTERARPPDVADPSSFLIEQMEPESQDQVVDP